MRGITCIRGRGVRCGEHLTATDDEELVKVYAAHIAEKHADLGLREDQASDDVFIQAYDVE